MTVTAKKPLSFEDWATSFSVPSGFSQMESDAYRAAHHLEEAKHYGGSAHSQEMAEISERWALNLSPPTRSN